MEKEEPLCKYCARLKLHAEERFANFPKIKEGVWHVEPACRLHCFKDLNQEDLE